MRQCTVIVIYLFAFFIKGYSQCNLTSPEFRSILINDPGIDDLQFFEIKGNANETLTNIWYIEIDGDRSRLGQINKAIDLSSYTLGANGLLLYQETTMLPAPSIETTVLTDSSFNAQNGNGTFLLVERFTGTVGDDLDINNDGVLELTPWCNIIDGIGVDENNSDPPIAPNLGFELVNDNGGPHFNWEPWFIFSTCSACSYINPWRGASVQDHPDLSYSVQIKDGSWFHDGPAGTDCHLDNERGLTPGNTESPLELQPTFSAISDQCAGGNNPLPSISLEGISGSWFPSFNADSTTTYTFTPDSGQCATSKTTLEVGIIPNTILDFEDATICKGTSYDFPDTGTITGSWNPSIIDTSSTLTYTFTPDLDQCVTLLDLDFVLTVVRTQPVIFLNRTYCLNEDGSLPIEDDQGVKGSWVDSDGNEITELNTANASSVTVTFVPTAGQGCYESTPIQFSVTEKEQANFSFSTTYCKDEITNILPTTSDNGITGTWNPETIQTNELGNYTYTFIPHDDCALVYRIEITINPCDCKVSTINEETICQGEPFLFPDGTAAPSQAGEYQHVSTVTHPLDCDEELITILQVQQPELPTAISPRGNMKNRHFKLLTGNCAVEEFYMKIYNRWGELVFETNESTNSWDGEFNGKRANGIFIWDMEYTINNVVIHRRGSVMVLQ